MPNLTNTEAQYLRSMLAPSIHALEQLEKQCKQEATRELYSSEARKQFYKQAEKFRKHINKFAGIQRKLKHNYQEEAKQYSHHEHLMYKGQAEAWEAVCNELEQHKPYMFGYVGTGLECAINAIRELAAGNATKATSQAKQDKPVVDNSFVKELVLVMLANQSITDCRSIEEVVDMAKRTAELVETN